MRYTTLEKRRDVPVTQAVSGKARPPILLALYAFLKRCYHPPKRTAPVGARGNGQQAGKQLPLVLTGLSSVLSGDLSTNLFA